MSAYSETVAIDGVRRLEVRIPRGDITLRRRSGDLICIQSERPIGIEHEADWVRIRSEGAGPRPRSRARPAHATMGEGPSFGVAIGEMVANAVESILAVDFDFSGFGSADIEIGIPAALELPELVAHTGLGDIRLEDLTANLSVQTSKGRIVVDDCGGSLRATTGMGEVRVDHFAGTIALHTGAGDAGVVECDGGGVLHTGSGDIKAEGIAGAWDVRSGAGDVEVRIAGEASLDIGTGAGDVKVVQGALHRLAVQSGSGDVTCSSLLSGPRHTIFTGHGDIEVAIADPPGARLQILSRNGSVESEYPLVGVGKQGRYAGTGGRYVGSIGDGSVDIELRTTSGDITIKRRPPHVDDDARDSGSARPAARQPSPEVSTTPGATPQATGGAFEAPPAPGAPSATAWHEPASGGNPRLAILENLQAGKLSVNEAAALLESLQRRSTYADVPPSGPPA